MQNTLIEQGISLMIYGMGTVFVFLTLLVFATGLMSKLVQSLSKAQAKELDIPTSQTLSETKTASTPQVDSNTLEAIKQAISLHRQR